MRVEPEGFNYGGSHLTKFVSLADLDVRGLRNTYRRPGIGVALSARVEPTPGSTESRWISASAKVPITAFVSLCQLSFFLYNSGNPILLSATRLQESLVAVRRAVDPEGKDAALNQMVIVSHQTLPS